MKTRILNTSVCLMLLVSTVLLGLVGTASAIAPSVPGRPAGPNEGSHHVIFEFSVSPVFAQSNNQVSYNFSWGDGTNTWVGPFDSGAGPVVASHQWTANGVYQVKVQAKDQTTSEKSAFSLPSNITIVNLETPQMPDGPITAGVNQLCEYSIPSVRAPSGHDVLYMYDWNDTFSTYWVGPHPSGWDFPVEASHGWEAKGTYQVRVKAKDNTTAAESAWSLPLNVTVGKSTGPLFDIAGLSGGLGASVGIKNMLAPSKYVDYTIEVSGGVFGFHVHKYYNGTVYIPSGATVTVKVPAFLSFGKVKFSVTAKCGGEPVASAAFEARVLLFYVTNIQEV